MTFIWQTQPPREPNKSRLGFPVVVIIMITMLSVRKPWLTAPTENLHTASLGVSVCLAIVEIRKKVSHKPKQNYYLSHSVSLRGILGTHHRDACPSVLSDAMFHNY